MSSGRRKPQGRPEEAAFTVDTNLFRELGELLVGRDSTALLELVKNSYDADASVVTVDGRRLGSTKQGQIVVSDDGTGMDLRQFRKGFLRLAARNKVEGDRHSGRYHRRYTGEKGVGRLATHKLARVVEVESVPWSADGRRRRAVRGVIDWAKIERRQSLDKAGSALDLLSFDPGARRRPGTSITLSRLRHGWTPEEIAEFVGNAESFSPPESLIDSPRLRELIKPARSLFKKPRMRSPGSRGDPGFRVELTGDFQIGSDYWDELVESVEWVIEIDAKASGVVYALAPTARELQATDNLASGVRYKIRHPSPDDGPFFQARICVRSRTGSKLFRSWSQDVAGIRMYLEGFRVLPYGSPENDWLELNRDYAARRRSLRLLDTHEDLAEDLFDSEDEEFALTILPSDSYVGAVLLTQDRSGGLQALVNREGFVENSSFEDLKVLVRLGVDLLTRARASGREEKRAQARRDRQAVSSTSSGETGDDAPPAVVWRAEVAARLERTREELASARKGIGEGKTGSVARRLAKLDGQIEQLAVAFEGLTREQQMVPVLASVGIQMGEFVHEINGLLAMAAAVDSVLTELREEPANFRSAAVRKELAEAHQATRDLRERLERQAAYLIDITSPTARRRRSRQPLSERIDRAAELLRPIFAERAIRFANRVDSDLRTPAMFPAELAAILLNLLTNAVKAADDGGRITASARTGGRRGGLRLRIENTGQRVDLEDAERWFRPFETTTTKVDPLLGQGMGFGLPITRGILEEYAGEVRFVAPRKPYATAIEVEFPP